MLEYATSEAILKFPASEVTENAQRCWIRVHFGACVCIGIVYVYVHETNTSLEMWTIMKLKLDLNWFPNAKLWTRKRKREEHH